MLCLLSFALINTGCKSLKKGVTLIGIDESGEEVSMIISKKEYSKNVETLLTAVNESTLPALTETNQFNSWKLRTVVVGIGLKFEGSLGPIAKASVSPAFKMAFSNAKKPTIP